MGDPFDLARFVEAQASSYLRAFAELERGRKESHWMWFIFPQVSGLGSSPMAWRYAIGSLAEARAYLAHPVLGPRFRACVTALLKHPEKSAHAIFGSPDDLKLRSSLTLFAEAAPEEPLFGEALEAFYGGHADDRTLEILRSSAEPPS